MAHERGGPAAIGTAATVVLAGDLSYAASRWGGAFGRWFLVALGSLVAAAVLGRLTGSGRVGRWGGIILALAVIAALVLAPSLLAGGSYAGELSGLLAGVSAMFAALAFVWLRGRRT